MCFNKNPGVSSSEFEYGFMFQGKLSSAADNFAPLSQLTSRTVIRINSTHFKYAYENEPINLGFFGVNYPKSRAVGIFNMWGIQIPNTNVFIDGDNMGPFDEIFNDPKPEAYYLDTAHKFDCYINEFNS